jgi:hypothetical protein
MAGLYLSCTRHWRSAMLPWFSPTCCYPQSTPLVFVPRQDTSPTHTSNTSQRISNFPLEERRNNRIAFCQNHMKRTAICWWQKALQRRGRIWRKLRRRRRRRSALCNRAAAEPRPSFNNPYKRKLTLSSLLCAFMDVLFTGWIVYSSSTDNLCCRSEALSHYDPSCVPSWICHSLDEELIPHLLTIRVV